MKKYEEEHYLYEKIKDKIYPVIRNHFYDRDALNGKQLSGKDTTAVQFAGDMLILFAIQRGEESYEILKDAMLPPEISVEELFETACVNLARDVEFVIGNTWYSAYAIIAEGKYESSALCLKHIWKVCVEKLKEDLVICVPARDTVFFAPVSQTRVVEKMKEDCRKAYEGTQYPVSRILLQYSMKEGKLTVYEA